MKWTSWLHKRFVDAVNHLGGATEAKPRPVLDVMNVPGVLTVAHVKSHLQKYRIEMEQEEQRKKRKKERMAKLRSKTLQTTSSTTSTRTKVASGAYFESSLPETGSGSQTHGGLLAEPLMGQSEAREKKFSIDDLDEAFNMLSNENIVTLMADIKDLGNEKAALHQPADCVMTKSVEEPSKLITERTFSHLII